MCSAICVCIYIFAPKCGQQRLCIAISLASSTLAVQAGRCSAAAVSDAIHFKWQCIQCCERWPGYTMLTGGDYYTFMTTMKAIAYACHTHTNNDCTRPEETFQLNVTFLNAECNICVDRMRAASSSSSSFGGFRQLQLPQYKAGVSVCVCELNTRCICVGAKEMSFKRIHLEYQIYIYIYYPVVWMKRLFRMLHFGHQHNTLDSIDAHSAGWTCECMYKIVTEASTD